MEEVAVADYNTLQMIAKGTPRETVTPKQLLAKAQLDASKTALNSIPANLSPKDRYRVFKRETRDVISHPDINDKMWELEEQAYPGSSFKSDTTNRINRELDQLPSDSERGDYFKNNASSWPSWLQKEYEMDIERSRIMGEGRALELSRINNKLNTEDAVNHITTRDDFKLSHAVGRRIHSEDLYSAIQYGYTPDEIHTDEAGRIAVSVQGALVPIYSLVQEDYNPIDPQEEYILYSDNYNMIDKMLAPKYKEAEQEYQLLDRENKRVLFDKLDTLGNNFTEHHNNIILDYAQLQFDPVAAVNQGLEKVVTKAIDQNIYTNEHDLIFDFIKKWEGLLQTSEKRGVKNV